MSAVLLPPVFVDTSQTNPCAHESSWTTHDDAIVAGNWRTWRCPDCDRWLPWPTDWRPIEMEWRP